MRDNMKKMMIAFFVCMLFVSCDSSTNTGNDYILEKSFAPSDKEQVVDIPNEIKIVFPANSLQNVVEFKIKKTSDNKDFIYSGYTLGKNVYDILIKGEVEFNTPIYMEINYDPSKIPNNKSPEDVVCGFLTKFGISSWKKYSNVNILKESHKIRFHFSDLYNLEVSKYKDKTQEYFDEIIIGDGYTTTDEGQNDLIEVKIGTQIWSARNLDVTKYQNGDVIPNVTNIDEWTKLTTGAWCYLNNNPILGSKFGKIYNWYAVNDPRGLAPKGWRIPTVNDWNILIEYLGGTTVAGGKMKEAGTANWSYPNTGATNESGFNALPSGFRNKYGVFSNPNTDAFWWTNQKDDSRKDAAFDFSTQFNHSELRKFSDGFVAGNTVRCIKN